MCTRFTRNSESNTEYSRALGQCHLGHCATACQRTDSIRTKANCKWDGETPMRRHQREGAKESRQWCGSMWLLDNNGHLIVRPTAWFHLLSFESVCHKCRRLSFRVPNASFQIQLNAHWWGILERIYFVRSELILGFHWALAACKELDVTGSDWRSPSSIVLFTFHETSWDESLKTTRSRNIRKWFIHLQSRRTESTDLWILDYSRRCSSLQQTYFLKTKSNHLLYRLLDHTIPGLFSNGIFPILSFRPKTADLEVSNYPLPLPLFLMNSF